MSSWTYGLSSFPITLVAAPFVRSWLCRAKMLDYPNIRSSHYTPVPRGGGVACLLGVFLASILAEVAGASVPWTGLIAAGALGLIGFIDDRYQLPAAPRLAAQVVIGAVAGGLIGDGAAWIIPGALIMVLAVNTVNFMDGINALTPSTLTLWGTITVFVALRYQLQPLAFLGTVTAAAAIGFLPWNAPRAKIFLGDSGSYFFGGLAASGVLLGTSSGVPGSVLIAPFMLYLTDVIFTLLKRARRGSGVLTAHREHFYQRLAQRTGSHMAVTLFHLLLASSVSIAWLIFQSGIAATITGIIILAYVSAPRAIRTRGRA